MIEYTTPVERARCQALRYRELGYNPLPSRSDVKGPALPAYADYWDRELPDAVFDHWQASNIQLMTGARWGLCVVDCDGDEAHATWQEMAAHMGGWQDVAATWWAHSGGGGYHYYFTVPGGIEAVPSRRLWGVWDTWAGTRLATPGSPHKGDWAKHKEIRLLGDRSLVIAPPSIHVTTGRRYEWAARRGPDASPAPSIVPAWLLGMPAVVTPRTSEPAPPPPPPVRALTRPSGESYSRRDVLASITDKAALARSWGLRMATSRPNQAGWFGCYAFDREDRLPSASFHEGQGIYFEQREGVKLSLFDLAVGLGAYPSWQAACDDLGARFIGPLAS